MKIAFGLIAAAIGMAADSAPGAAHRWRACGALASRILRASFRGGRRTRGRLAARWL